MRPAQLRPQCGRNGEGEVKLAVAVILNCKHSLAEVGAPTTKLHSAPAVPLRAEEEYGMTKTKRGQKDVDGSWLVEENSRTVQVKAWSEKRVKDCRDDTKLRLKLANPPDDLLVLLVHSSERKFTELYKGPASEVGNIEVLKGVQFRKVSLRHLIAALPQSVQDEIYFLSKRIDRIKLLKNSTKTLCLCLLPTLPHCLCLLPTKSRDFPSRLNGCFN